MINQRRILDTANAVPDPGWLELAQCFPNAVRTTRLTGMSRAMQPMLDRVAKSRHVRIDRITGLVSGDIERRHPATAKLFYQTRCHEPLLAIEMTQGA